MEGLIIFGSIFLALLVSHHLGYWSAWRFFKAWRLRVYFYPKFRVRVWFDAGMYRRL